MTVRQGTRQKNGNKGDLWTRQSEAHTLATVRLMRKFPSARVFLSHVLAFSFGALILLGLLNVNAWNTTCSRDFDLLNPELQCDKGFKEGVWDYEPLRDALTAKKLAYKAAGTVSHLSIYFRDLNNGPRFGIGEYDKFHPASLRKLPVLIAYLHMADLNPAILDQTTSFSEALKTSPNIEESEQTIKPNTPYTVRELLTKMIVYSDNSSFTLLVNELNTSPPVLPYSTFRDLDILRMMLDPNGDYVSIQNYANLFPVLYNTGYLSKEMSQYALELLSQVTYKEGLVAGVPPDTRVAHKFGQRYVGKETELHDCGIVYHPEAAYVLCVMTSGRNFDRQKSVIADVSRTVYDAVTSVSKDELDRPTSL